MAWQSFSITGLIDATGAPIDLRMGKRRRENAKKGRVHSPARVFSTKSRILVFHFEVGVDCVVVFSTGRRGSTSGTGLSSSFGCFGFLVQHFAERL
jgi:hypothetical protein